MSFTDLKYLFTRSYPELGVVFFLSLTFCLGRIDLEKTENKYLNPPPEHIEYFHFGFRESMADSFWLRWIQDFDNCQTYLTPVVKLDPSVSKVDLKDLTSIPRYRMCDNSWSFKMLDTVTLLAPQFAMPYLAGASTLAILVEDLAGATKMYDRGLAVYPNDWQLLYRASFHYQFNLQDPVKAAELLLRAADQGGPDWMRSLASRLYTKAGKADLGLTVLEAYRQSIDPDNKEALERIDKRIAELKAQLAP